MKLFYILILLVLSNFPLNGQVNRDSLRRIIKDSSTTPAQRLEVNKLLFPHHNYERTVDHKALRNDSMRQYLLAIDSALNKGNQYVDSIKTYLIEIIEDNSLNSNVRKKAIMQLGKIGCNECYKYLLERISVRIFDPYGDDEELLYYVHTIWMTAIEDWNLLAAIQKELKSKKSESDRENYMLILKYFSRVNAINLDALIKFICSDSNIHKENCSYLLREADLD